MNDSSEGESPSDVSSLESALHELHLFSVGESGGSDASGAITTLAKHSKGDPTVRQKLANPAVLKILVDAIECSLNDNLETVDLALRCIGNACIDNDDAREHITDLGFSWALQCIDNRITEDLSIRMLAAKVLYNVCNDYEPAQRQCFKTHVHYQLISLVPIWLQNEYADERALLIELLFWISSHKPPAGSSTTSDKLPGSLSTHLLTTIPRSFSAIIAHDLADYAIMLEIVSTFIRDPKEQVEIILSRRVQLVWNMLVFNEARIAELDKDRQEDQKLLVPLSTSLMWCLSDMAANPAFSRHYDISDTWIMREILATISPASIRESPRTLAAAYQIFGNLLWLSKDIASFERLVTQEHLGSCTLDFLSKSNDVEVLHAAAGVLLQLCRTSPDAQELIGRDEQALPALLRLCRHENPGIKQDGVRLLQALGRDCQANQMRFAALAEEVVASTSNGTPEGFDVRAPL